MKPNQDEGLNRRDMMFRTAQSAAGILVGLEFSAANRALAQDAREEMKQPELEALTQFSALTDFAHTSAALAIQIEAVDAVLGRASDRTKQANWRTTRAAVVEALEATQDLVVSHLRNSYNKPGNEENHAKSIAAANDLLAPHVASLKLLLPHIAKTEQVEDQPAVAAPAPKERALGIQIEVASPFESALAETGLYRDVAGAIDMLAEKGLLPLLDRLSQSEGGFDLKSLNNKHWRGRLNLKRATRPQDVVPERIFEAVLNHASQAAAIELEIARIDEKQNDNEEWQRTREHARKSLDQSAAQLEEGVARLLEAKSRPKPGDAREAMANVQSAQAGVKLAKQLLDAHIGILELSP